MTEQLILLNTYCLHYRLEPAFVLALEEEGLIEIIVVKEERYVREEQLSELERFSRWYRELGIPAEGIGVIQHLLKQIQALKAEAALLRERLDLYE